jgi:hypothetical protein
MIRDNDDPRSPMRQFADFLKREGADNLGAVYALEVHTYAIIVRKAFMTYYSRTNPNTTFRQWLKLWLEEWRDLQNEKMKRISL